MNHLNSSPVCSVGEFHSEVCFQPIYKKNVLINIKLVFYLTTWPVWFSPPCSESSQSGSWLTRGRWKEQLRGQMGGLRLNWYDLQIYMSDQNQGKALTTLPRNATVSRKARPGQLTWLHPVFVLCKKIGSVGGEKYVDCRKTSWGQLGQFDIDLISLCIMFLGLFNKQTSWISFVNITLAFYL